VPLAKFTLTEDSDTIDLLLGGALTDDYSEFIINFGGGCLASTNFNIQINGTASGYNQIGYEALVAGTTLTNLYHNSIGSIRPLDSTILSTTRLFEGSCNIKATKDGAGLVRFGGQCEAGSTNIGEQRGTWGVGTSPQTELNRVLLNTPTSVMRTDFHVEVYGVKK